MKKIAFIIRLLQKETFHGGGEKLFYNLITRCSELGYQVDIYCSKSDINSSDNKYNICIINEEYDHLNPHTMEKFYSEVKSQISEKDYDFVISENITPPVDITFLQGHSLVNRLKRDKNIFEAFFYNFRKVKKERMKFQEKWLETGYRKIFTVSKVLKNDIIENFGISEDKISVIYPGVNINEQLQTFSRVGNECVVFGIAAPGFKIKGGFIFLKALGVLKTNGYNFKAKIIYPKFKKNLGVKLLLKLQGIENNVEFLPYQENMADFYKSIDCLVAPSVEDTFNLAVLEAMSFGKPCIVSSNAGACEIINEAENGFVFSMDSHSHFKLAIKMAEFADNPTRHQILSENAFKTAQYYSWTRTFEQFISELEKLN
jgi:glycosyltransferase involved in cell wall biosynthesis